MNKTLAQSILKKIFLIVCITSVSLMAGSQSIYYSETTKDETKTANFDIIGKYGEKLLVFKNLKNASYISVYDQQMKLIENVELPFIPAKVLEYDIIPFNDFSYIFFQFQQRNVASLMAVKIDKDGKPVTTPAEIDTTHINYNASRRVYQVIASEDKSKLMAFKINSRNQKRFSFETQLFNADLSAIHASNLELEMDDQFDFLTDFYLDNEGIFVFGRGRRRSSEDNISQFYLITKQVKEDQFVIKELKYENISLDEVKLRIDNAHQRYLFTAFYYKGRRGGASIEGVANAMYDKVATDWTIHNVIPLNDDLRADARTESNIKNAFNDFFIRQILIRRDGGFIMTAECLYTTSQGGGFNRWDMFGNPYMMGSPMGWGGWGMAGPGMWGSPYYGSGAWNTRTRFHADNVVVLVFDKEGRLSLSNVIRKKQYDDQSEAMVSYQTINTGNALHFLYNSYDSREVILSYQSIDSDGKVTRNPTMRSMDPKYQFMPRYARQVASRTIIIPCINRNYLAFSRIDF